MNAQTSRLVGVGSNVTSSKSSRVGNRAYKARKPERHQTLKAAIEFAMRKKYRIVETVCSMRGDRVNVVDSKGKPLTLRVAQPSE